MPKRYPRKREERIPASKVLKGYIVLKKNEWKWILTT